MVGGQGDSGRRREHCEGARVGSSLREQQRSGRRGKVIKLRLERVHVTSGDGGALPAVQVAAPVRTVRCGRRGLSDPIGWLC